MRKMPCGGTHKMGQVALPPLTMTILCGRFLLCEISKKAPQSFFPVKNSSDDASSKGRMSFFLLNILQSGLTSFA